MTGLATDPVPIGGAPEMGSRRACRDRKLRVGDLNYAAAAPFSGARPGGET